MNYRPPSFFESRARHSSRSRCAKSTIVCALPRLRSLSSMSKWKIAEATNAAASIAGSTFESFSDMVCSFLRRRGLKSSPAEIYLYRAASLKGGAR